MISFFRTKSALKINFKGPQYKESDKGTQFIDKQGVLFVEMAKGEDKNYDWNNKLLFAISVNDMPNIFAAFHTLLTTGQINLELLHFTDGDSSKQSKKLTIQNAPTEGTWLFSIFMKKTQNVSIYLNKGELLALYEYLKAAFPLMLGLK